MVQKYLGAYGLFLLLVPFVMLAAAIVVFASSGDSDLPLAVVTGGDPIQGQQAILDYGCGACHAIAGIPGADGKVGPPLTGIVERSFIAGRLPNNEDNLMFWIRFPQSISPGSDMPDLNVSEPAARDIAAYLYTLR